MKIMAVVVLYEKKISELPFYSLITQLLDDGIGIVCYDNSQQAQSVPFDHPLFKYQHDSRNLGIASAYNYAFNKALTDSCEGILLLDHDSEFSMDFIQSLQSSEFTEQVAIIAPTVFAGQKQISPVAADNYINHSFQALKPGIYSTPSMGINSGSLVSCSFLQKLGGFNEKFSLDFLDHWLFFELYRLGYQLQVIDFHFDHDLSVLDYSNVSHHRYESILAAENLYYSEYQTRFLNSHKLQLLKRTLKLFVKEKDRFFWKKTLATFFTISKK